MAVRLEGVCALHAGRVEEVYDEWEAPDLIVSDGAYGIGGFPGDPRTTERLGEWYAAHVVASHGPRV